MPPCFSDLSGVDGTSPHWWLVIGSLRSGGTERQVANLANELAGRGHAVSIALIDGSHAPTYALDPRVAVVRLANGGGAAYVRAAARLARLIEPGAIVYSFLDLANLLAAAASLRKRVRLAWGVRDSDVAPGLSASLALALTRLASRRVDVLVGNASACVAFYRTRGFRPRAWAVVGNGIDATRWRPDPSVRDAVRAEMGLPREALVVGCVARADPKKRHDLLLAAFAACRTDAHLVLIGRGTDDPDGSIARDIRARCLEGRVHALGERSDLTRLTAALDVACCASDYEGFPNSLLEAMACGVACLATDVGGVREALGDAGVIVESGSVCAFRGALDALLCDPARRQMLGAAGRARVRARYSNASMCDATIAAVGA
jgi:glycosyltransferase involved in cell wall biosynthesis